MALSDEVTARLSTTRLVQLTNPDEPGNLSVDAARLDDAVDDTEAEFEIRSGIVFDDTDTRHIRVGVQGVIYFLLSYRAVRPTNFSEVEASFYERLDQLAEVTGRDRIEPSTDSVFVPSTPSTSSGSPRPDFDRAHFRDIVPRAPGEIEEDNS